MKINVVGLGYIGLPTALSLAAGGWQVVGTDKNKALLQKLSAGEVTFEEKGLPQLFERAMASGNLSLFSACVPADVYIVAVPTPYAEVTACASTRAFVRVTVHDCCPYAPRRDSCVESTIAQGTMTAAFARSSNPPGLPAGRISISRTCRSGSFRAI